MEAGSGTIKPDAVASCSYRFRYFVILGAMRTGSNFLEEQLGAARGVTCHGELFNPHFVGRFRQETALTVDMVQREAEPQAMIEALRTQRDGALHGFRYFGEHDPRILDDLLADPECGKIILSRNPLDSFVSLGIAQRTGQWKLTNFTRRKSSQMRFDEEAFERHLNGLAGFYNRISLALQKNGQTPFHLSYEDLTELSIINGLLAYLGVESRLGRQRAKVKKQNPAPLQELVENYDEMEATLQKRDYFSLFRDARLEPRRAPRAPLIYFADQAKLIYMPIGRFVQPRMVEWLEKLNSRPLQKAGRRPKIEALLGSSSGIRKFTYLEHPLRRAHQMFCERILADPSEEWVNIRKIMRQQHDVPIAGRGIGMMGYTQEAHRDAFKAYLKFCASSLRGLSSLPIHAEWASQWALLETALPSLVPDFILRSENIHEDLALLSAWVGKEAPEFASRGKENLFSLEDIYDEEMEALCREAYEMDYLRFSVVNWSVEPDID